MAKRLLLLLFSLIMGGTLAVLSGACAQVASPTATKADVGASAEVKFANPDLLVETSWVAEHLNDSNLRIVDVRPADKYKEGHVPNSVSLPSDKPTDAIYDQTNPVKWIILPQDKAETLFGELGIGNDTRVVILDDARGLWAARLFWMLEYYGHKKVSVLNGGIKAWEKESRELTKNTPQAVKATFKATPQHDRLATKDQVLSKLGRDDVVILATIPKDEFEGGNAKSAKRGGHIPGAKQMDWTENLAGGDVSVLKMAADLKVQYEQAGITKDKEIIVY